MSSVTQDKSEVRVASKEARVPTFVGMTIRPSPVEQLREIRDTLDDGKPVHVKSDMQLRAFANFVASRKRKAHSLVADPGLGKSTRFPLMLAEQTKAVVVMLEYSTTLVHAAAKGLRWTQEKQASYKSVVVLDCSDSEAWKAAFTATGPCVIVVSTRMVLRLLAEGKHLPEAYVLHDEAHYSDFATYTWRNIVCDIPWVKSLVAMSATLNPNTRSLGTVTPRFTRKIVANSMRPVKEWDQAAPSDPWSIDSLKKRRTLVFSDDLPANAELARRLSGRGIRAACLTLWSTVADLEKGYAVFDSPEPGAVLFVDTGYRNGYNFDVDVVIDLCRVREVYVDETRVVHERYRVANRVEVIQAAARVGRSRDGWVYKPDEVHPEVMPVLSLGEVRHAAALHICLGYKPDHVLVDLVPEVQSWSVAEAVLVLKSPFGVISRSAKETAAPVERVSSGSVTKPSVTGPATQAQLHASGLSRDMRLNALLRDARVEPPSMRSVADALPEHHPGVRYDVPESCVRAPDPYWVKADDAERMMRLLLSGKGDYDIAMLKPEEYDWFVARIIGNWNSVTDDVVDQGVRLAASQDVLAARMVQPHIVVAMREAHATVALLVRRMESIITLLRRMYEARPFAVMMRDVSEDVSIRRRYTDAHTSLARVTSPQYTQTTFRPRVITGIGDLRIEDVPMESPPSTALTPSVDRKPKAYTWYARQRGSDATSSSGSFG